jgi:hypothetical protein
MYIRYVTTSYYCHSCSLYPVHYNLILLPLLLSVKVCEQKFIVVLTLWNHRYSTGPLAAIDQRILWYRCAQKLSLNSFQYSIMLLYFSCVHVLYLTVKYLDKILINVNHKKRCVLWWRIAVSCFEHLPLDTRTALYHVGTLLCKVCCCIILEYIM